MRPTINPLHSPFDLSGIDMSNFMALNVSPHQILKKFLRECAAEPSTRTVAATALVLSLWQLRANMLSDYPPSLILLNAAKAAPDPIDSFVRMLTQEGTGKGEKEKDEKPPDGVRSRREQALWDMASCIRWRLRLCSDPDRDKPEVAQALGNRFNKAKGIAYGEETARPYSKAWHDKYGFLTDNSDVLIARLKEKKDLEEFRRDITENACRLYTPLGIGNRSFPTHKYLAVSGSITEDRWDEDLVLKLIGLGLPVIGIPHTATEPLVVSNATALGAYNVLWRNAQLVRASTSLIPMPPFDWLKAHAPDVRRRLRLLPGDGTFAFAIEHVLRQLNTVCSQIAAPPKHSGDYWRTENQQLMWDMYALAYRGITLGVAALAWHVLGFNPGCPRDKVLKLLRGLRTGGPMSCSEIRRKFHLTSKEQRDLLLQRLAAEDLVRIDGGTVTATTFEEFVNALHTRPALVAPTIQPVEGD